MRAVRFRFTLRRMMVAVAIVAATLGLGIDTVRQGHFRRRAAAHVFLDLRETKDLSVRDYLARKYHAVMVVLLARTADLLGEPEREDAFPGKTFEQVIASTEGVPCFRCGPSLRSPATDGDRGASGDRTPEAGSGCNR